MQRNTVMEELEQNRETYRKSIRGSFLIIPVLVKEGMTFDQAGLDELEIQKNELDDKSKLITKRCADGYVKKYLLSTQKPFELYLPKEDVTLTDFQLFLFDNGIGFITLLTVCENRDIRKIYNLVNNGYVGTDNKDSDSYTILYDKINSLISDNNLRIYLDRSDTDLLLNESYVFNFALTDKRFNNLETLYYLSENVHKQIELEREFEDVSETDINYTSGARDVNLETYRWGCCISSLDISFVYACQAIPGDRERLTKLIKDITECDLFLTILTMIQKYSCMRLNETIHESLYTPMTNRKKKIVSKSTVRSLKQQALEFRAFGTLAPSQISRWHNVCETYRFLLEAQGVDEALQEIEQKIELIKSAQEQRLEQKQNIISAVIAAFGLSSIIAAVMQVVDYLLTGSQAMIASFSITFVMVMVVTAWMIAAMKDR